MMRDAQRAPKNAPFSVRVQPYPVYDSPSVDSYILFDRKGRENPDVICYAFSLACSFRRVRTLREKNLNFMCG